MSVEAVLQTQQTTSAAGHCYWFRGRFREQKVRVCCALFCVVLRQYNESVGLSELTKRERRSIAVMASSSVAMSSLSPTMSKTKNIRPSILQPTPDTPWSVDVVSAIPVAIVERNKNLRRNAVNAAVAGRWHCIALILQQPDLNQPKTTDGEQSHHHHHQLLLSVWYSSGTLSEQKCQTLVWNLRHGELDSSSSSLIAAADLPPVLLAMTSPTDDTAYLYAVNATTGCLLLWKLNRRELQQPQQQQPQPRNNSYSNSSYSSQTIKPAFVAYLWGRIPPPLAEDAASAAAVERRRTVTALTVEWKGARSSSPMILLGCSDGSLYYVTQAHVPIGLRVHLAVPAVPRGILGRLWQTVQYHEPDTAVACLLPVVVAPQRESSFVSMAASGKLLVWKVTPTESSAKAIFEIASELNLLESLRAHFANAEHASTAPLPLYDLTVIKAAINTSDGMIHVVALTQHADEEARLYWLCLTLRETTISLESAIWLSRFAVPESVIVTDLCVASNGMAYAVLQQDPSLPTIVMALEDDYSTMSEVDLPSSSVQSLLINSMAADVVTHGVTVLDASGLGLRIRLVVPQQQRLHQRHQDFSSATASGGPLVSAAVPTLITHLKSTFLTSYKNPDNRSIRLPPSLEKATVPDLEAAVMACAVQLQGGSDHMMMMSSSNALDMHIGFITMLQQTGIYRDLSMTCKWKLLTVGQTISVLLVLGNIRSRSNTEWEDEQLQQLSQHNLNEWMATVQADVLAHGSGENFQKIWLQWLVAALEAAVIFREERAGVVYDVSFNPPPLVNSPAEVPVWTSSPAVQTVLFKQLEYWHSTSTASASPEDIETVVQFALLSCSDSYSSCPGPDRQHAYVIAHRTSFDILRKVKGLAADSFLFELARAHRFFNGLCQVALDHDRRNDHEGFALDPLFKELALQDDVETGMNFGVYVLKWHTDRELFGHVLQYGKLCPDALNQLMHNVESLSPYRWIHAVRQGDYNAATDSLFENANMRDTTLKGAQLTLSIASIASSIVERGASRTKDRVIKRRRLIDKKCELINAQKELIGDAATDDSHLWQPDRLLNHAIRNCEMVEEKEDKIQAFVLALAVCTTFEKDDEVYESALLVWFKAIVADTDLWETWLNNETDLTSLMLRDIVLQNTVFGGLLQQSEDIDGWKDVSYNVIESDVFEKLGKLYPHLLNGGMQRLLRSVTSEDHELSRGLSDKVDDIMMIS